MLKRIVFTCFLVAVGPVHADSTLVIANAWIRHVPGNHPMAGYFVLENDGSGDRSLVGASSPAFDDVRLHRTSEENGIASMAPVESVAIPAHGRVAFQPGGYHLMMMHPRHELQPGDSVAVTLHLGNGEDLKTSFAIKPPWQE